jgi:long-chain acyl-CoA synthetase
MRLPESEHDTTDRLYAVVVPDMQHMRSRKIVNVGDLLRFEIEGLSALLPPLERAHRYEIWFEPLPRASTKEIDRDEVERRVRERQSAAQIRDAPWSEADRAWREQPHAAAAIAVIEARVKSGARVRPDANLEIDLGLDSIDRVELLATLECSCGVRIPPTHGC